MQPGALTTSPAASPASPASPAAPAPPAPPTSPALAASPPTSPATSRPNQELSSGPHMGAEAKSHTHHDTARAGLGSVDSRTTFTSAIDEPNKETPCVNLAGEIAER